MSGKDDDAEQQDTSWENNNDNNCWRHCCPPRVAIAQSTSPTLSGPGPFSQHWKFQLKYELIVIHITQTDLFCGWNQIQFEYIFINVIKKVSITIQ